jgi:molybdate transport system ATP-binding protein
MRFDIDVAKQRGDARIACRFVAEEALTVLFGPSGIGKTSVLHMIAGLVRPGAGHVRVAGRTLFDGETDIPVDARRCGYVFQDMRLFPHMSVRANLLYARRGRAPADFAARIAFLDIDHLLDRRPATLSGGEARRVAIGRALLADPAFLLLDEPLASLDQARGEGVMRAIEHLRDAGDLPILLVTHDAREVARLGAQQVEVTAV